MSVQVFVIGKEKVAEVAFQNGLLLIMNVVTEKIVSSLTYIEV